MPERAFYFDLASPAAYLAAEQVLTVVPQPCEWVPVRAAGADVSRGEVERRAAELGLQAVVWPEPFPFDSDLAMRVATYAKGIGKAVAFALAAFRQAFAAGRALSEPDWVLVAAAACEMHPRAVLRAAETRAVRDELAGATAQAAELGVTSVPAVRIGERLLLGEAALGGAAAA